MIELTRLNGHPIVINSDLIKYLEASPDTMLTLIHGEKLMVLESCEEVVNRILRYRARLLEELGGEDGGDGVSHAAATTARRASLALREFEAPPDDIVSDFGAAQRRRAQRP